MKIETENVAVPVQTKQRFAKACRDRGIKLYAAAEQALLDWLAKNETKKKGAA